MWHQAADDDADRLRAEGLAGATEVDSISAVLAGESRDIVGTLQAWARHESFLGATPIARCPGIDLSLIPAGDVTYQHRWGLFLGPPGDVVIFEARWPYHGAHLRIFVDLAKSTRVLIPMIERSGGELGVTAAPRGELGRTVILTVDPLDDPVFASALDLVGQLEARS